MDDLLVAASWLLAEMDAHLDDEAYADGPFVNSVEAVRDALVAIPARPRPIEWVALVRGGATGDMHALAVGTHRESVAVRAEHRLRAWHGQRGDTAATLVLMPRIFAERRWPDGLAAYRAE